MRNLVSIQEIKDIQPIENADRIVCATILGWKIVIKKDEFKVGDKCVYFEVDSYLPIEDKYEFLRSSSFKRHEILGEGFRIKTQCLRGQISQGLVLKLSDVGLDENLEVGTDVTELLNVKKWEPLEKISNFGKLKEGLPDGVSETDETRIQSIYESIIPEFENKKYYISTKIDGTSFTVYMKNGKFGVCSHTNEYIEDDTVPSSLWDFVRKHKIEEKIRNANIDNIVIQGELAGPGIQKNHLKLINLEWFVFSIKDLTTNKRIGLYEMLDICKTLELKTVPIEEIGDNLIKTYPTLDSLLERAKGKYDCGTKKEGIVIRPIEPCYSITINGPLSFKVLNNDFLLKED